MTSSVDFRLYKLRKKGVYFQYPLVAVNKKAHRIISICEDEIDINIINKKDELDFLVDYTRMSRLINFDITKLDDLVRPYTEGGSYSLDIQLKGKKRISLDYLCVEDNTYNSYDLTSDFPEKRAKKILNFIYKWIEENEDQIFTQ